MSNKAITDLPAASAAADADSVFLYQGGALKRCTVINLIAGRQGPQGDPGPQGDAGPQGEQGPVGDPGMPGPIGPAGPAHIYAATSDPAGAGTVEGDVWINPANGDVYSRNGSGSWDFIGNITGPQGLRGEEGQEGPIGLQGDPGPQGPQGDGGPKGDKGDTGDAGAGPVDGAYLSGGELHVTAQGQDFNVGNVIGPQGNPGADGAPGEVTQAALDDAISGTSANSNGVALLGLTVSDPPTQAEMQSIADKLDELITALRR